MATGRVFFNTRTRPMGPYTLPEPDLFNKQVFYTRPDPPRRASFIPTRFGPNLQPKSWPNNNNNNNKFELKPRFIFAQI